MTTKKLTRAEHCSAFLAEVRTSKSKTFNLSVLDDVVGGVPVSMHKLKEIAKGMGLGIVEGRNEDEFKLALTATLQVKKEGGGTVEKGTLTIKRSDGKMFENTWICDDGDCIESIFDSDIDTKIIKTWMYEHICKTAEDLCWGSDDWKKEMTWDEFIEAVETAYSETVFEKVNSKVVAALKKEAK